MKIKENLKKNEEFMNNERMMIERIIDPRYSTPKSHKRGFGTREGKTKLGRKEMMKTEAPRIKNRYQGVRDRYHVSPLFADF